MSAWCQAVQYTVCIIYSCRAGYRSEAVYIRSEDAGASNGVGYVHTLAIAAAFGQHPQLVYAFDIWLADLRCPPAHQKYLGHRP